MNSCCELGTVLSIEDLKVGKTVSLVRGKLTALFCDSSMGKMSQAVGSQRWGLELLQEIVGANLL